MLRRRGERRKIAAEGHGLNKEQIARSRETITEIRAHLKKHAFAVRNDRALDELRFLLNQLKPHDTYIAEKCGQIQDLAADFWSARKHHRYHGGPSEILARIGNLFDRIENQLDQRERILRDGEARSNLT